MLSVDDTIRAVERLYTSFTGQEPPAPNGPYAIIPPEKDAGAHLEASAERLSALLAELAPPSAEAGRRAEALPAWSPLADVLEGRDEILIQVDLPGVERSDVRVTLAPRTVTIAGERRARPPEGTALRSAERARGRFVRQIAIGPDVRVDDATARLAGGVLEIRLPKGRIAPPEARVVPVA